MKKFLFLFALLSSFQVMAQMPVAARWNCRAKMTSEKEGVVVMKMDVADGWHVYGTVLPDGGPRPMAFDLSQSVGVVFIGDPVPSKAPLNKFDDAFDMNVQYWDSSVVFEQKFRFDSSSDVHRIIGTVQYQGCNGQTCAPPKKQKIDIVVNSYKPGK